MKNMKSIKLLLPSQFKTGFYLLFLYTRQSMRLLTAGSLVRVQLGEPVLYLSEHIQCVFIKGMFGAVISRS